jgi:acyl-[acyl-carrier-protein]-phospholipid O-acyltransferase/long-chain-fatty-acid--[acyl-carrier-protein] ligase
MVDVVAGDDVNGRAKHPLRGLLVAQLLGAFNDNAWKQVVILLAIATALGEAAAHGQAAASSEAAGQEQAALVQTIFMIPLVLFSLPGGVLADRVSKRFVILAMKWFELVLMVLACAAVYYQPTGGLPALMVLGLLGVQAALFSPAKYGILPEILPHERLSSGNGLLEMCTNLAIIGGTVAGGLIIQMVGDRPWLGAAMLTVLSVAGLAAAQTVPSVPVARAEGALAATVRLAWSAIRSDRILRLAVLGQIFVWTIGSLVPPPIMTYATSVLELPSGETGLPLGALGIGIGIGCVLAGRLSASKVEYGLLPLGALGLTLSMLGFALIGPGLAGTIFWMTLVGISSGLLFVPLNALIQWRAPDDRRGAVIALANVLVYAGMFAGSLLALGMAKAGITARGTFLGASIVLSGGFLWALWLVPDAFLRFLLILLANTFYRLKVLGRLNVPQEGPALLAPNHVSFVDGLFVIASIDRPVRFVVYSEYFQRLLLGPFLRAMKAIPISGSGGPKMILQAFREAGKALDEGELVCIFPEGQITRTGMTQPFQRGLERIVRGRSVPIIPVHIDRAHVSVFSPMRSGGLPERIPLPVTVSFGTALPAATPVHEIRRAVHELDREAWVYRKADRRPLHHAFVLRARRHPFRLAMADLFRPRLTYIGALAASVALARSLRPRWAGQANVGILLPTGVASILANLAATLSGRAVVNFNFTLGPAALSAAASQAALRTVVTSRSFLEKAKVQLPEGVEPIWIEDILASISRVERPRAMALAWLAPVRLLERFTGATRASSVDDTAAIVFSSGSTGEPKGVVLTHFNIDSNVTAIESVFRTRPGDRILDALPPFHSFGYLAIWLGLECGLALVCHPNPLDAASIGGLVERYEATILLATPTFLQIYLRRCSPAQFGSLRLVVAGAEKLAEPLARAFEDAFGVRPLEGYGMTECAPVVAVSTLDYRAPGFFQPGSRRGYVGHPLPGVSVQVVDPDTGDPVGPNTPGMVLVKGPNVMRGYLNRDDATDAVMRDGWYVTGDIGLRDEDGFLKITGRLTRFSKIGGEMVPHGTVEEALHQAIDTEDQVFVVTAVDDGRGCERLAVLHTVGNDHARAALDRLSSLGLPNLFIPRRDAFIKVDALPILGSGKLDLRAAKRIAEERLAAPAREESPLPSPTR